MAVVAAMSLTVLETTVISATLFFCRGLFGYIFSNEKEVVEYVAVMAPLVCVSVILDGSQGVLTGKQICYSGRSCIYIFSQFLVCYKV